MAMLQMPELLDDAEIDLVIGAGSLVTVGPIIVKPQTIVGVATVGVIFQVAAGSGSSSQIVNVIGVKATVHI